MKLATWNVNSVRARAPRVLGWLAERRPDVACFQELKCLEPEFPADEVRALGYTFAVLGQKTYNGVAILARAPLELTDVSTGFGDGGDESQARLIAATISGPGAGRLRVVSVYVPNGQAPGSEKYAYKLDWYRRLRAYMEKTLAAHAQVVLAGDFNVAPEAEDVHDPALWEGKIHFSRPEREALAELVALGLTDTLRAVKPTGQFFTWWDYRQLAFPKNHGLRIDHILASPAAAARVVDVVVDREARKGKQPSDHAPVIAELTDA